MGMTTIFIAIFEGVESKNILRTGILRTLLAHSDIRLVLLVKSEERKANLQLEFRDPRILYEVVEPFAPAGFDRFFRRLKFYLLRTDTTLLRREMRYDLTRNAFAYYLNAFAHLALARRFVRAAVRAADFALVRPAEYAGLFEKYQPRLVIAANLFDEPEIHLLREARRRGVKTIGLINSWDKPTARCALRLLPDKVIVFNDLVKGDMIMHHDIRERDIFVGGVSQYDRYFNFRPLARELFFQKLGIDSKKRLIVYAPVGGVFGNSDWKMIDILYWLNGEGKFGENTEIFVRFPPNDFFDEAELKKRPHLRYVYPGVRFSQKRGIDWDMTEAELEELVNTLYHMSLLVGYASSIGVDAAVFDKPVMVINFEVVKAPMIASPSVYNRMAHYQKALATGGIRLINNEEELMQWVRRYLADPSLDREGRRRLVETQCKFLDGKSGERIGEFILSML